MQKSTIEATSFPSPTPPANLAGTIAGRRRTSSTASRDNSAKTMVADQISQAILSTSNLLHIMTQSSAQDSLVKLPKSLLAKASTIKRTGQVLEQMPLVISSLDAHMDHGLQSVPHLETVTQLLGNIENNQLKPFTNAQLLREEPKPDTSSPLHGSKSP